MSPSDTFEVRYWQQSEDADKVEAFDHEWKARSRFEELYRAAGFYNLKLIKLVTTAEVLDKGYERNVWLMARSAK